VRERLLEAALQVLAAEGIHALTQTRVADRAGLRQSHLTYYFPTRSDLLKAIVVHVSGEGPGMVRGDTASLSPTLVALKAHLGDRVTDSRMARLMLALTTASDEDPSLKRWMVEFDNQMREMFGALLESMGYRVQPQELALFHASMVGTAVLHSSEGTDESARAARKLVDLAFDRLVASARRI
jgi:AcrR family transcriptional regulator